jgi:hypothetical protein
VLWGGALEVAAGLTVAPSLKSVLINKPVITAVTLNSFRQNGDPTSPNVYVLSSSQFITGMKWN